jgi:hypothetical protein
MLYLRAVLPLLVGLCGGLAAAPALAQVDEERVNLIVSFPSDGKHAKGKTGSSDQRAIAEVKKHAGDASGHALSMTKAETWSVPKHKVEAVKQAAAKFGLIVTEASDASNHILQAKPADNMQLNDKQRAMMDLAKSTKGTMHVRLVLGPTPEMLEHALSRKGGDGSTMDSLFQIKMCVSEDETLTINRTSVDIKPERSIWRGTVPGTGARVTLMWWPNGKVTGTIQRDGRMYGIKHLGGQAYLMVEMSEEHMPAEHAPVSSTSRVRADDPNLRDDPLVQKGDASILRSLVQPPTAQRPPFPARKEARKDQLAFAPIPKAALADKIKKPAPQDTSKAGQPPKDVVIDVIVAYTKKAASNYGDVREELVELAIEESNESFRNSGLGHVKLRLVHAYQTSYDETGAGHFDHVWRFADKGDGYVDEVHKLRDKYRADVGILLVDDPSGCGLSTRVYADASEAFSVVHHACAVMTYSLGHEVGHLIGARHDRSMDTSTEPFPYGHGYVHGTWRDIMSYKQSCNGCPRLPVWSSPNVLVKGEPAGAADTDNARVISEQAARVAAFK